MHFRAWQILFVVFGTVLPGCNHNSNRADHSLKLEPAAQSQAQSWVHSPSPEQRLRFRNTLSNYPIAKSKTEEALARLSSAPSVVLTPEEARQLSGTDLKLGESTGIPMLLRMVRPEIGRSFEGKDDEVRVFWEPGTVYVVYSATREKDMPLRPTAIIAIVPSEPQEVFVDAPTAIY